MTTPAEQELLSRVRHGDRAAMGALLQQHQGRLYNVCLRMVANRDDAAELTQDVMVRIVEHIDQFKGDAALSTWMTRIAMNHAISHLRKAKLRRTASLDGQASSNGRAADDQASALRHRLVDDRELSPPQRVENAERSERLARAIAELDEEFRSVLVLRDVEQLSYQHIAQVLEVPLGTVRSRLFRARLALRERLVRMERQAPPNAGQREVRHG